MPTDKQRRETARRHLERQLQRRQQRDAARRKYTLIGSVIGTVVAVAAIVVVIAVTTGGKSKNKADNPTVSSPTTTAPTPTPTPTPAKAAKGTTVTFDGVTVKGANDLTGYPTVTAKSSKAVTKIEYKDLVVGKGAAATAQSAVTAEYVGVLYKNGTKFDSSWDHGSPSQFSLNGGVIPGFQFGIGGTTGVPPMRIGGRRIMIIPAKQGYGTTGRGSIPANADLVFVVDLEAITQ